MPIVLTPTQHFQGASHIAPDPVAANRDLATQLREIQTQSNAAEAQLATITSPFLFKGEIAANTDFPLVAAVQTGWLYTITADVTDNAGVTYTNSGQVFLAGQEIAWNGTNWTVVGDALTSPFQFRGNIALNSDFPLPAATPTTGVRDGWVYLCTAGVTDDDATKTNTGQVFLLGDTIAWRTNAWYVIMKAPSVAVPAAIGAAAAGTSGRPSNDDHVHAHGDQLGGTLHADVIAGGADGFMTGAQATSLAAHVTQLGYEFGAAETVTGAGVAGLTTSVTNLVTAGAGDAITLADGTVAGQEKIVRLATVTAGGHTSILTIATGPGPYTLSSAGDFVHLKWTGAAWELLNLFRYGLVGDVAALGAAAAGASLDVARINHVHAHGDQLGGTLHADVVAGGAAGFMTGVQATNLANVVDDHVTSAPVGLDMVAIVGTEVSAALSGNALDTFVPTHIILKVTGVTGVPDGAGAVNIGTTTGGDEIAAAVATTGLLAVGDARVLPLAANTSSVAANATLYANSDVVTGTATAHTLDVFIIGRQV